MSRKILILFGVLILSLIFSAHPMNSANSSERKLKVFVSVPPQAYFVERIGGEFVEVYTLVQPGHSPATYEPTPRQMTQLSGADILFSIGVPYEDGLLPKVKSAIKSLKIVNMAEGIKLRKMEGHADHHGHEYDPHVWLDPLLVKKMANRIYSILIKSDTQNAKHYKANIEQFLNDLDSLHQEIKTILLPLKNRDIYVFHPSYGYFADRYNLKQIAVEIEGKEPGAKQLASLIERAKQMEVKTIFVQPQFSEKTAQSVAGAIGGEVVHLDPLAGDYISNLKDIALKIKENLNR
ncbi:MAG: zinc ABC transporter solute-binding protein [candidate division Zixibacteria bacterium]|nr:zinc ABC transporter solute-binding protein [candidate division Zixibacteria bacterium]